MAFQKKAFMSRFRIVFQTFSLTKRSALPLYLSEAGRGNRRTRSHSFQYHRPNADTDEINFSFFPRTIAIWNGLTTEADSAETVYGFKSKT